MAETVELKACPFCGGAPYSAQHGPRYTTIGCNECAIEFSEDETEFGHKWPDALAAWNRRVWEAEDQKIADAILAESRRAVDVDAVLRVAEEMERGEGDSAFGASKRGDFYITLDGVNRPTEERLCLWAARLREAIK